MALGLPALSYVPIIITGFGKSHPAGPNFFMCISYLNIVIDAAKLLQYGDSVITLKQVKMSPFAV